MSRLALFQAADAADKAWMFEVVRIFGVSDAGRARCNGHAKGESGSHLRELYESYLTERNAYKAWRR